MSWGASRQGGTWGGDQHYQQYPNHVQGQGQGQGRPYIQAQGQAQAQLQLQGQGQGYAYIQGQVPGQGQGQVQGQDWGNWAQWQQQYLAWQMQYGDQYAAQIKNMTVPVAVQPPLPSTAPNQAPPPPPPDSRDAPPPPPPDNGYSSTDYPAQKKYPHATSSYVPPQPYSVPGKSNNYSPQQSSSANNQSNSYSGQRVQPCSGASDGYSGQRAQSNSAKSDNYSSRRQYSGNYRGRTDDVNYSNDNVNNRSTFEEPATSQQQALTQEERQFDLQFKKWEADFEKWKNDNVNHPDRVAYAEYEKKFEACRDQLLQRKRQMESKRQKMQQEQLSNKIQNDMKWNDRKSTETDFSSTTVADSHYDNFAEGDYPSEAAKNAPNDLDSSKTSFVPSLVTAASGGIPGLDLVKDKEKVNEVIEIPENDNEEKLIEPNEQQNNRPDLLAISQGINSLLENKNLMDILSSLSQKKAMINQPLGISSEVTSQDSQEFQDQTSSSVNDNYMDNPPPVFDPIPQDQAPPPLMSLNVKPPDKILWDRQNFSNVPFEDRQKFSDVPFEDHQNFSNASFEDRQNFSNAPFGDQQNFSNVPFEDRQNISNAPFGNRNGPNNVGLNKNIPDQFSHDQYSNHVAVCNDPFDDNFDWDSVPLFEPVTVIEYNHKSMTFAAIDMFEAAQTFDYNHIPNEKYDHKNDRKPTHESKRDLERRSEHRYRSSREDSAKYEDRNRKNYDDRYRRRERSYERRDHRDDQPKRLQQQHIRPERERERERERSRFNDYSRPRERSRERMIRFNKRNYSVEKENVPKRQCVDLTESAPSEKFRNPIMHVLPSNIMMIDDILEKPGRDIRPEKIAIIMRGLPGSGKSYLAKLIKDKEVENGGGQLRILSIDDYFMTDDDEGKNDHNMKYVYEASMEKTYMQSLLKSFKKTILDGFFNFIIVDSINSRVEDFDNMVTAARQAGFKAYVCQMEMDVQACFKKNIHNRTLEDIKKIADKWDPSPQHFISLDATTLLQTAGIDHVQMEDVSDNDDISSGSDIMLNEEQNDDDEVPTAFTSKWEQMDDTDKLARLDGTSKPLRHTTATMEDFLQLDDWTVKNNTDPKKKIVRWADIEEHRQQEKMRAIGFVVGQTNWDRMTDPSKGKSALTQTKFIERVRKN